MLIRLRRMVVNNAVAAGVGAAVAAGVGVAAGAIPDNGGVIHACYNPHTGALRVIDTEAKPPQQCAAQFGEVPLSWNQQGSPGLQGATGPAGVSGPQGSPGANGVTGAQGPSGAVGPTGPEGVTGDPGGQGLSGENGATGPQGPPGQKGNTGPAGAGGSLDSLAGQPCNVGSENEGRLVIQYAPDGSGGMTITCPASGHKLTVQPIEAKRLEGDVFCTGPEETVHLPEGGTETINVGCFIQEAPGIVSSSPGGISNCGVLGGHCSSHFTPGTEVTLSESPVEYGISGETSKFEGWGGACSGTEPICKVTMSEDKTVTAKFGF